MNEYNLLYIVVLLVLVTLIGFLLYRRRVEVRISISRIIDFMFKAENSEPGNREEIPTGISVQDHSQINATDVVVGDKITHIYNEQHEPQETSQVPKLILMFYEGDDGVPNDTIHFETHRALPQTHIFGIELLNTIEDTLAKGININIEFSWRGNYPENCPRVEAPFRYKEHTWFERRSLVGKDGQPAILIFKDAQLTCSHGIPVNWKNFKLHLSEHMNGYLLAQYKLSSDTPASINSGELVINLVNEP